MRVAVLVIQSADEELVQPAVGERADARVRDNGKPRAGWFGVPVVELLLWGSECTSCGNTTPDSMVCDECGSSAHTRPLWMGPPPG